MATEVPHSAGTAKPRLEAPPLACDSHLHIYDVRFAVGSETQRFAVGSETQRFAVGSETQRFATMAPGQSVMPRATVADYRLLQARTGTTRAVVVQPRANGTDNAVTVDAVAQLGLANARGVAVLHPTAGDALLRELDAAGIRGLRVSAHEPQHGVCTVDMIEPLARRIEPLGWHVQLHLTADQLAANAAMIEGLPCRIVIDHRARLPAGAGSAHPAFALVRRLLDAGRTWVKLSGPYLDSRTGGPAWADVAEGAKALASAAPERMLWGSDWPHPTEKDAKPDDASLLDVLTDWAPTQAARHRILVTKPCELYGFAPPTDNPGGNP